jgi:branched-chain amino acid transport system ATP-binding protein
MTVLVNGAVWTEGTPDQIRQDPRVREVYLGHGEAT